ncbi:MAG: hypothetical protein IKB93_13870 [Clostridia bacterium]|nr:hypothetical protein [Clostridia bacterium]
MKKLTSYFTSSQAAGAAAYDLSENCPFCNEILIANRSTEKSQAFDFSIKSTFIGGATGVLIAFILLSFPYSSFSFVLSPLSGLIAGSVIGAISGSMLDVLTYEEYPECASVTVTVPESKGGIIASTLKKKGAVKTLIES